MFTGLQITPKFTHAALAPKGDNWITMVDSIKVLKLNLGPGSQLLASIRE